MSPLEVIVLLLIPSFTLLFFYLRTNFAPVPERSVSKVDIGVIVKLISLAGLSQWLMGRSLLGNIDWSHLISLDTQSKYNSQTFFDAYSFSHIIHGFILFYFFKTLFKKSSVGTWAIMAVTAETFWELLENTNMVINHYRSATISLNYVGDSVLNSACDTLFCLLGFYLATKLAPKYIILITIIFELGTLFWVHDNLTLNVLMLLYPIQAIKMWQSGV